MHGLFIGLTTIDLIYPLTHFPKENNKSRSQGQLIDIGGPATNAAFTFSALGGKATLISLVGKHPFSAFMNDKFREYKIHHIDLDKELEQNPIIASVMVNKNNGSRTIVNANPLVETKFKLPSVNLENFDVVCVDGFFGASVIELLKGNNKKIPVVFDGGSYKKYTDTLLDYVAYPILSEKFTSPDGMDSTDYLKEKGFQKFAITQGENPIKVFEAPNLYELPVPRIKAIDTLAAGDIFHGAFSWYIMEQEHNFRAALEMAAEIAGLSCTFLGPRTWVKALSKKLF